MSEFWQSKSGILEDELNKAKVNWRPRTRPVWQPKEISPEEPISTIPEITPEETKWYEKPKELFETGEEKLAEGISKVPLLPKVLEPVGKAFNWVYENLEKPFAAIITSPFSPDLTWKQGESFIQHTKREYDAWDAPAYIKGAAEFAMPLWWIPWFGWAAKGAKALGVGGKLASKMAKTVTRISEKGLPKGELLDKVLFKSNRFTRALENVPIVNKIVKLVGGEAAFAHPTSPNPLQITRRALVKSGFINDMRNGIKGLLVPKLQVLGDSGKILGMDSKGVVSNILDTSGKSQYLYDVLEGAIKNKDNYKFLTKESEKYVDTLRDSLNEIYTLARKEGVKVPKATIVHRIVKGKTNLDTLKYEATETGSYFEKLRTHPLMKEGVEAGVDYGLNIDESLSSTIDHYIKAISKKRFEKEVAPLGRTPKQMWDSTSEGVELALLHNEKNAGQIFLKEERLAELIKEKTDFIKHYQGQQILGENMAKFHMHPVFKNKIFPKEVVKTAEKILNDEGQKWLQSTANLSGTSRMLTASLDLSAPFIQGATTWALNPLAWGKAVKGMFEFTINPKNYYKYLDSPEIAAIRQERILAGGSSTTFEYFNALAPLQRAAGKIPGIGGGLQKAIGETWGRAETAFTGFGEVARNELWKAMRTGKNAPEELMDLARTIDRMTGVMSTEALAIGRTQQDFENAFVFFAPRYTRAGLSFVGDALKKGMPGDVARKSLGSLMASGLTFYYGAAKVLGQQPDLNPNSGRFLTLKVGDSHVGIGGIMVSLLRLGYDISETAIEDPQNLLKPINAGHLNRVDNPFIKWLYSRTAPVTSTLVGGIVEQADYFGEPFESVQDWGKFVLDKVIPIAVQGAMEQPGVVSVASQFGGLRQFPKSAWELLDEERDRIAIRDFQQPYDNLNDLNKMKVDKTDIIRKIQKDVDSSTVSRGDALSVSFLNREREREGARQVYEDTLWNLQKAVEDGVIDGVKFREEMQNAGYGLGVTYKHIDKQYPDVTEVFEKPRNLKDKNIGDIAYSEFAGRLYGENEFVDKYGLFQFDKYNQFIVGFRQKWGEEVYQYVQDIKRERDSNLPPLAKQYNEAKEILKPYWAVQDEVLKMFNLSPDKLELYPKIQRVITKMRKQMRASNPQIAQAYDLFYSQS